MMKKTIAIICFMLLSACTSPQTALPTAPLETPSPTITTHSVEGTATSLPTSTSTSLPTGTPTATIPTPTLIQTASPTVTRSPSEVSLPGTPLPAAVVPISKENYDRLVLVGQWGIGTIADAAVAADGSFFVVRSASGVAIYDPLNLDQSPRWIEFPEYLYYRAVDISMDGKYLLLTDGPWKDSTNSQDQRVFELSTRVLSSDPGEHEWFEPAFWSVDIWEDIVAVSPDGEHQLRTGIRPGPPGNPPDAVREMTDPQDGSLYYKLADPVTYVELGQNARPEGCDIQYYTPGGSPPALMAPKQVEFAPNSKSFAILYSADSFYGWKEIRVYNTSDGQLLATLGSYELPAVDVHYVPGQETLLVAYADGSINLWDVRRNSSTWQSRNFQPYTDVALISKDGQSVLMSSKFALEVRSLIDGSLQGRYDPTAFAVSPVENVMALGQASGEIEIRDIPGGEIIRILKGHRGEIYGMAFSPDGQYLVSSSYDCTVRLWDMQSGQYVRSFEEPTLSWSGAHTRMHARKLAFIPGTDTLWGFGTWHYIVKWEVSTGATLDVNQPAMELREFQFPVGEDQIFYIFNHTFYLDTGTLSGSFPPPSSFPIDCSPYGPETLDGKVRFTTGSESLSGYICVVNISDWKVIDYLPVVRVGSVTPVYAGNLFISPDGAELISVSPLGVIYVFQLDQGP